MTINILKRILRNLLLSFFYYNDALMRGSHKIIGSSYRIILYYKVTQLLEKFRVDFDTKSPGCWTVSDWVMIGSIESVLLTPAG